LLRGVLEEPELPVPELLEPLDPVPLLLDPDPLVPELPLLPELPLELFVKELPDCAPEGSLTELPEEDEPP